VERIRGLSCGDRHQQRPESSPVVQLRERTSLQATKKAIERTEGDIFAVDVNNPVAREVLVGKTD
jgi:hypothetical protein